MRAAVVMVLVMTGCEPTPSSTLPTVNNECIADATTHGRRAEDAFPTRPPAANGKPPPLEVDHTLVEGRRISGETKILPDDRTKDAMRARGVVATTAVFQLCLDAAGVPSEVTRQKSSCFPRYDERIRTTMLSWRFSPYLLEGRPVEVCTGINFVYKQR